MVRCGTEDCQSTRATATLDADGADEGAFPSMRLDADGNPLVAFHSVSNGDLLFARVDDLVVPWPPVPYPASEAANSGST